VKPVLVLPLHRPSCHFKIANQPGELSKHQRLPFPGHFRRQVRLE
jgi:hypothetical protein